MRLHNQCQASPNTAVSCLHSKLPAGEGNVLLLLLLSPLASLHWELECDIFKRKNVVYIRMQTLKINIVGKLYLFPPNLRCKHASHMHRLPILGLARHQGKLSCSINTVNSPTTRHVINICVHKICYANTTQCVEQETAVPQTSAHCPPDGIGCFHLRMTSMQICGKNLTVGLHNPSRGRHTCHSKLLEELHSECSPQPTWCLVRALRMARVFFTRRSRGTYFCMNSRTQPLQNHFTGCNPNGALQWAARCQWAT